MKSLKLTSVEKSFLKKAGVQAIYLFGSRAQGRSHALSDYDFAVLTSDKSHKKGGQLYNALYEILSKSSPRTLKNDVIDIVFLHSVGLEMQFHVIRYGKILFETDSKARLAFEERTTLLYADFRPVLDEIDRTILESL